jgi:ketosteroid isomerase-like protein
VSPEDLELIRSLYDAMNRRELFETFERLETEIREVIHLGPDAAIFMVHHQVRGAASGAEVERGEAHLWSKREGRIASLREFATAQEAREAAGEARA